MDRRPLPDLAVFALVAERRSFRRAAAELGVSASALSHAIRNIETRLGVRLLHRTTRSVAPTEAGERLLARLAPALADIDEALNEVASFRDRPSGRLRLNMARSAARMLIAPEVGGFLKAYPDIRLEIVTDDGLVDIVAGGFDAGLRLGESLQADMIAVPVSGDVRLVAVGSPDYLRRCGAPASPADLTGHVCFRTRFPSGAMFPWEFERRGETAVVHVDGPMVVAVGWGLGGLFALAPWLYDVLRWAGAAYMVYLAWRIATTEGLKAGAADGEPMTFLQAAAFQWVNPKAWAMALGAVTAYAPTAGYVFNVVAVAVIFTLINGPCVASWAGFGQGLRRFLDRPTALRTFNIAMALLLLASLIPFFMELGGKASAIASSR